MDQTRQDQQRKRDLRGLATDLKWSAVELAQIAERLKKTRVMTLMPKHYTAWRRCCTRTSDASNSWLIKSSKVRLRIVRSVRTL